MKYGNAEYAKRREAARKNGERVMFASLCPVCWHAIRRQDIEIREIAYEGYPFCACGEETTRAADQEPHGLAPGMYIYHHPTRRMD